MRALTDPDARLRGAGPADGGARRRAGGHGRPVRSTGQGARPGAASRPAEARRHRRWAAGPRLRFEGHSAAPPGRPQRAGRPGRPKPRPRAGADPRPPARRPRRRRRRAPRAGTGRPAPARRGGRLSDHRRGAGRGPGRERRATRPAPPGPRVRELPGRDPARGGERLHGGAGGDRSPPAWGRVIVADALWTRPARPSTASASGSCRPSPSSTPRVASPGAGVVRSRTWTPPSTPRAPRRPGFARRCIEPTAAQARNPAAATGPRPRPPRRAGRGPDRRLIHPLAPFTGRAVGVGGRP